MSSAGTILFEKDADCRMLHHPDTCHMMNEPQQDPMPALEPALETGPRNRAK